MRKKIVHFILAFLLANSTLLVAGCGKTDSSKDDLLAQIQARGSVIIAMEGQWAPWTYHDQSGELVGFDTEIGKAIADKLGVKAEFVEGEWDGLFAGLDVGRYDMIINGVEIIPERAEKYDFTSPYAYIKTALCVLNTNTSIKTFEDLNGKVTANSLGSTYANMAADYGASVQNVDTLAETIAMLESGRAEATLNAEVSFYDYLKEHPEAPISLVARTKDASEVSIPIVKSENTKAFRDAVNRAIEELYNDGTLSALSIKYFGSDITVRE